MLTGTITLITSDQKYGNLRGDDGITRMFERPEQSLRELLSEGDAVTFLPFGSPKGPAASDVRLRPCPYCKKPIHTTAHFSVCAERPPGVVPPVQSVIKMPARIGEYMVQFVPFGSQPDRGRFYVMDLQNREAGIFARYDNASNFALGRKDMLVPE